MMINKSLWNPPQNEVPLNIEEQIAARYGSPGSSGSSDGPQDKSAAAMISAIAGIASAVVGGVSAYRANQTNINLTREAYARNLEQWLRENSYNSPLAQRQRLMAANFNPALMYGGSGSLGTPAASSPQQESATVNPYIFGNPLQSLPSDIAQTELLEAQKENIQAQTKKTLGEVGLIDIESQNGLLKLDIDKEYLAKMTDAEYQKLKSDIDMVGVQMSEIKQHINNMKAEEALKWLEVDKMRYYVNNIQPAELDKLCAEIKLTNNQAQECIYLLGQKLLLLKAQTAQAYSSSSLNKQLEKLNFELTKFQKELNANHGGMLKALVDMADSLVTIGDKPFQFDLGKKMAIKGYRHLIPGEHSDEVVQFVSSILGILKGFL